MVDRTEVEAVAEALSWADAPDPAGRLEPGNYTGLASAAIAALDAVRARSSQGEDHEAGIEAAYVAADAHEFVRRETVRAIIVAYLSRVSSPERDTVKLADVEEARRIIDKLWAEALMCDTAMLVDHVAVECRKALAALNGKRGLVDPPPQAEAEFGPDRAEREGR